MTDRHVIISNINLRNTDTYATVSIDGFGYEPSNPVSIYCLDPDVPFLGLQLGSQDYTVFSSDELARGIGESVDTEEGLVPPANPPSPAALENLDLINWLLNQESFLENYTAGEIQAAIWTLLDQLISIETLLGPNGWNPAMSPARVQEILAEVEANLGEAEGFQADETQVQALVLIDKDSTDGLNQPLFSIVNGARLGDFVWDDKNQNGFQDLGEGGIEGVTVKILRDLDGDGEITINEIVQTTTTDNIGLYNFQGLTGLFEYQLLFDVTTAENGNSYTLTKPNQGDQSMPGEGDDARDSDAVLTDVIDPDDPLGIPIQVALSQKIILEAGEYNPTIDAGYFIDGIGKPPAGLGDFVFEDLDADGIQEFGEPGIPGATVKLLDEDGNPVLDKIGDPITTTTDGNGFYEFTGLTPGGYKVMFVQPEGFDGVSPFQVEGSTPENDSDANPNNGLMSDVVNLESGEFDDTIDAGFFQTAGIGDFVFEDLDADGIQDLGEPGVPHATVKLLDGGGNDILDENGDPITTITDENGFYEFTGLTPGDYKVMFVQPEGFDGVSPFQAGNDPPVDSDANPDDGLMSGVVNLESGEFDKTIDAGFFKSGNPAIDIEKFVNGIDVTDINYLPEIAVGADVTFTYEVANTGSIAFDFDEVVVIDDNGTPDMTSDDFMPTLDQFSDENNDGILSAGETWLYESETVPAQDLGVATPGQDVEFMFSDSSSTTGYGNVRDFELDGVSIDVRAFRKSGDVYSTAYVGIYGSGLGVTNRGEDGSHHRVDNGGSFDFLLFEFDQDVIADRAFLDAVRHDSDITIWIGDRNGVEIDLISDSLLASFGREDNNGGGDRRWADFNVEEEVGDTLIIAAKIDDHNDAFKLKKLDVSVPGETGTGIYKNIVTVDAGGVSDSDMSGYTNPSNPSISAINIEKLVRVTPDLEQGMLAKPLASQKHLALLTFPA